MNNIEDKLKNLEQWKKEKGRIGPFLDAALECYNRSKIEAQRKDYQRSIESYKKGIENYIKAFSLSPRYFLPELVEAVSFLIEAHINNIFNFKSSGDKLEKDESINEFLDFLKGLEPEERECIDPFLMAKAYINIGDLYYYQKKDLNRSYEFYVKAINSRCGRPFLEKETFSKMADILFDLCRFKEALVCFVSVLSYDRSDKNAVTGVTRCLQRLNITQHRDKFLHATPRETKKLIMEVL